MATRRKTRAPQPAARPTYNRADPNHVLVDPRWLFKVLAWTVLAALVCAYLLMCALFRTGSWQWVLHPTHVAGASTGLPGQVVHFGPDGSGTPQLTGEWIPAEETGRATVLYLRPGDGQLDFADGPTLQMLHQDRLDILAFDYRGYGQSAAKPHPTEERMQQDAEVAWNYLTGLRGIPPSRIVIYGAGVGATLATNLAAQHPNVAGLVLRNATADVLGTIQHQPRARMFPVRLLLKDRFNLHRLDTLATPKLLLDVGDPRNAPETEARTRAYARAADPKMTVTMQQQDPVKESESLRRWLDWRDGLLPIGELLPNTKANPASK